MTGPADAAEALRAFGLTYPETHLKSPWPGHADLAVRDKAGFAAIVQQAKAALAA